MDDGASGLWRGGFDVEGGGADLVALEGEDGDCGELCVDFGGGARSNAGEIDGFGGGIGVGEENGGGEEGN